MAVFKLSKIILFAAFCVSVSAKWKCPDTITLMANLTKNGTFETDIGFNSTFPLVKTVDGNVTRVAPWINLTRMWLELNFTAEQKTPLMTLLGKHPNITSAAISYNCNITYFNCTAECRFTKDAVQMIGEEPNVSDSATDGDVCTDGYDLQALTNHSHWLESRWSKMCDYFLTLQFKDQNLAWMTFVNNETVRCEFNTTVPIRYNITLYGQNLTRMDSECTQNENQTVVCVISNSTEFIQNTSLPNCTIHRNPWPVSINAKFNYTDEELQEYTYDDPDYYEYLDDYYTEESNENDEDGEEDDEEDGEEDAVRLDGESGYEKQIEDPKKDTGNTVPPGNVLLVAGIVALATVGVLVILFRKRKIKPQDSSTYCNHPRHWY